jgi:hypothetical protein
MRSVPRTMKAGTRLASGEPPQAAIIERMSAISWLWSGSMRRFGSRRKRLRAVAGAG